MVRPLVVLAVFSALVLNLAIAQSLTPDPALSGYITRCTSRADFDVNGQRVLIGPKTQFWEGSTNPSAPRIMGGTVGDAFFGERVDIYGKLNRKKHTVEATEIVFLKLDPHTFSGIAIVDRILTPASSGNLTVRADGYPIRIDPATRITYAAPLSSLSEIQPNIWIAYRGVRGSDGVIVADLVSFQPNNISNREDKLIQKSDYDPAAVSDDSKQSKFTKYVLGGIDPKKIPPYHDSAMQARVDRIGASLIPVWQRNLPIGDPSKISFRFQLVDFPKVNDALTLPSGIILIPHQVVERLQNDSQLATVLADNIACALEKQSYRLAPATTSLAAVNWATTAGGFLVPGLGLAGGVATYASGKSILTDLREQSGRVSLDLLHDAGYDIQQAPVAWWLLATKPSKDWTDTPIPPRSINLYQTIGLLWKDTSRDPLSARDTAQSHP